VSRLACASASALLLTLAGRPWGLGWLALVAFVPLMAALRREPGAPRAAALTALTAFAPAFVVYEAIGPFAPAALPLVAVAASLPFALVGAVAARLRRAFGARTLLAAFPLLWLAAETLPAQAWLLGRFATPLFAVGYSQAGLPTMQLARIGGVAATGLAVLACNAMVALLLLERVRRAGWGVAALVGLVWLAALPADAVDSPTAAVRIVQEALPDAAYAAAAMLPEARAALLRRFLLDARRSPLPPGPALTVWPEGALPGPLPVAGPTGLEPLLAGLGPALVGAPARLPDGIANAVYAWQGGALHHLYDKRRLAPIAEDGLVAGRSPGLAVVGGVRVAPLVCFEAAFPSLARSAARAGAQLLVVLTNDAFGRYLGTPRQHLRVARFRAVEAGRPLAFASNAGPSAVVDARGAVLQRTLRGGSAVLVATPRLVATPTPYLRWGDWPGTLALVGASLLALASGVKGGVART